jgi:hypothetical protein
MRKKKEVTAIAQSDKEKRLQDLKEENQKLTKEIKERRKKLGPLPLNEQEKTSIKRWKAQRVESHFCYDKDGDFCLYSTKTGNGTDLEQADLIGAAFAEASGSNDFTFAGSLLIKCVQSATIGKKSDTAGVFNSIMNVLTAMKPADEIEGMLITRLIAIHAQSMHFLSCVANEENSHQGRETCFNRSTKLFRAYNETLETLMRYRRRGEQRVIVQHVNVNDGAQAMIGSFQAGGGVNRKIEEPHG